MSQLVNRFESAVKALVGDGPVKQRLNRAYSEYLKDLQQVDLPVSGNNEFGELHVALHSVAPVGKIDEISASVRKMSASDASRHARTIVRLYTELLAMEQTAKRVAESVITSDDDEVVRSAAS